MTKYFSIALILLCMVSCTSTESKGHQIKQKTPKTNNSVVLPVNSGLALDGGTMMIVLWKYEKLDIASYSLGMYDLRLSPSNLLSGDNRQPNTLYVGAERGRYGKYGYEPAKPEELVEAITVLEAYIEQADHYELTIQAIESLKRMGVETLNEDKLEQFKIVDFLIDRNENSKNIAEAILNRLEAHSE